MGLFNRNDDQYISEYMTECPKCGHRYNKKLHLFKCPDCGHININKGLMIAALAIVLLIIASSFTRLINPVFIIIIINVICFIKNNDSNEYGNCYYNTIVCKQYYRLITSGFTHADVLHIVLNMFSLYNIGTEIYYYMGFWLFMIIYFISMILGGLLSTIFHHRLGDDYRYSVGASGAICGLIGFYIIFIFMMGVDISYVLQYTYKALLPMIITAFDPRIDNIGHISGLIVGIVSGFVILTIMI